ncbi:imidazolonepropionase [Nafulsella turpanensis]|uniref:imidazolonepropionase n=1 Tax=Nafulsella turpanensis TaxID=1265690 RepID=UPI00034BEACC|nr:imidazolonepropionase [Nafulsella turpanensis]
MHTLIGPFSQIIPLDNLAFKGPLTDENLRTIDKGGVLVKDGKIAATGPFEELYKSRPAGTEVQEIEEQSVLLPGFIDSHTHICFAGSRARDYSLRVAGKSYQEILKQGGGIHDTVGKTREASEEDLVQNIIRRVHRHIKEGVTTIEVKSGYGLNVEEELKMLRAIRKAGEQVSAELIPTCLAAHVKPKDFAEASDYLTYILEELLPKVKAEKLTERVDIFVEPEAFPVDASRPYLQKAKEMGFALTLHADQFTSGGSLLATEIGALSADHLESSTEQDVKALAHSNTVATVLPGASLGLGMQYSPARRLLDAGACLAIATDWNPGSAPMGDLLLQASLLGAAEKLSMTEVLAGLTFRAAAALALTNRGTLIKGALADMQSFPTHDFREILYFQGKLKARKVWKSGKLLQA